MDTNPPIEMPSVGGPRQLLRLALWFIVAPCKAWFAFVMNYGEVGPRLALAFLTLPLFAWAALKVERKPAGKRILLVEDEPINQMVAKELLSSNGLIVDTAENGIVAVEKAQTGTYDLILMDMQMPQIDGLEAGMNDFLSKPVVPKHFYEALMRWL